MDDTFEFVTPILFILVCAGVIYGVYGWVNWYATHPCLASHIETQYEQPISVVVGGGKYGGGVGIPIGNIKPIQVTVCDKR